MKIRLTAIVFDAGTQIRASIDTQVVSDYAEAMTNGATFPPIVLFHDGNTHYLADGFHRFMAAQRLTFKDIEADVRAGTKEDALWFALGANRLHGKQLTLGDKKRAVVVAVEQFTTKTQTQIAAQIGCSQGFVSQVISTNNLTRPSTVSGRDGKVYPSSRPSTSQPVIPVNDPRHERVAKRAMAGESVHVISTTEHISSRTVARIKRDVGAAGPDKSRSAVAHRHERIREMAAEGHTSSQIAAALGLDENTCRVNAKKLGIVIPGDTALGKTRRHDSARIVENIVMDAEHLTADVSLIDFASLKRPDIAGWIASLNASRDKLGSFIRRLMKEQQKHEAA